MLLSGQCHWHRLPVRRAPRKVSAFAIAQQPTNYTVKVISRNEDSCLADESARTIALAMCGRDENSVLWVRDPKDYYREWYSSAYYYQLWMPSQPMIHTFGDCTCVAYAYWYPEQKPAPVPGYDYEAAMFALPWNRPQAKTFAKDLWAFLDKTYFLQEHGPFLYLAYMAVHPAYQGEGLGSAMLEHLTGMCDKQGKWMYLESCNEDNQRLYERFGFQLLGHDQVCALPEDVPGITMTFRAMGRPPRPRRTTISMGVGTREYA